MISHNIFFQLSGTENVIITLEESVKCINPCYEEYIVLSQNNKVMQLARGTIYHNMQQLINSLTKTLNNDLPLHKSITRDIGYLYNEYHYDERSFPKHTFPSGVISWTGYLYYVWEGITDNLILITWIYNDSNGNIIFEITPFYPYMYCEPEEEPNYISYDEWIKTYKPYLIRTLSRKTAQEWLSQAEFLIKTMDEYVRQWEEEQKKKNL